MEIHDEIASLDVARRYFNPDAALAFFVEKPADLPAPEIIAADIAADLEAALEQFATIAEDLK